MIITVAAAAIGLVIGLCRGGRLRNLTRVDIRWAPLGLFGLAAITWAQTGASDAPELLLASGLVAAGVAGLRNARIVGLGVVGVGLLTTAAPLLANGTIPVDPRALAEVTATPRPEIAAEDLEPGRRLIDDDTLLAGLGEVIPVPELGLVLSFGDLLIAIGLADALHTSVRRRRPGGIPVAEIFAADDGTLPTVTSAGSRRERPVEVRPGRPVPVPMGWGRPDDDLDVDLTVATRGPRARAERVGTHRPPSTHVPWPWRRTPPRPHHPTMRVGRDGG